MTPDFRSNSVTAFCPTCNVPTSFAFEGGSLVEDRPTSVGGKNFLRVSWVLTRCAGCTRAGLAEIANNNTVAEGVLVSFHPRGSAAASVPASVPTEIVAEYREAEKCADAGAWRASSALLRSVLEKTLSENGYSKGVLAVRIDEAAADGAITAARARKAHDNIRVLGNDILHDDWREVTEEEFAEAHHYAQRVLEDFYDDRAEVKKLLIEKNRLSAEVDS